MLVYKCPRFSLETRDRISRACGCVLRAAPCDYAVRRGACESLNGRDPCVIPTGQVRTNCLRLAWYTRVFRPFDAYRLVHARIVGEEGEDGEGATLAPQHLAPEPFGLLAEDVRGTRRQDEPGAFHQLLF